MSFLEQVFKQMMEEHRQALNREDSSEEDSNSDDSSEESPDSESTDPSSDSSSSDDEGLSQFEITKQFQYPKTIEQIRKEIRGQKIYVSLTFCLYDRSYKESDDTVVNIIVGPMKTTQINKKNVKNGCFLLKSLSIDRYRAYSKDFLLKMFNDAMNLLWPNRVASHSEEILLLITEESDIIIDEAVKELCLQFPRMIHLPCMARLLSDVKNNIRFSYSKAEQFHVAMRHFLWFLDNEGRYFYKETDIPMGQYRFLDFCKLLADDKNFDMIKKFFNRNFLTKGFAKDYSEIKDMFADPEVKKEICEVNEKYTFFRVTQSLIRKLPKDELFKSVACLQRLLLKMKKLANSPKATDNDRDIYNQFNELLKENKGYAKLVLISKFLSGKEKAAQNSPHFPSFLSKGDIERFRFAPLGAINRKWCLPIVDELIYSGLKRFPVEYIDCLSVENGFGKSEDYEDFMTFICFMEKMKNAQRSSLDEDKSEVCPNDDSDAESEKDEDSGDSDDISSDDSSGPSSDSDID